MSDVLKNLRSLQEIDTARMRCEKDLLRIPKEQQLRASEVEAVRQKLERAREGVKRMRAEEKALELDLRVRNEKLEKLTVQANMARDSATLLATNHQIQTLKGENARSEDRALGLVDRIEEIERDFPKQEAQLAAQTKDYDAFAAACEKELVEVRTALGVLVEKRKQCASSVPPEMLDAYDKMLSARNGLAVCEVDGDVCSGCSMSVSPNDLQKVRGAKDPVRCKSCGRYLYLPG